jgi:hypothetical protein
MAVVMGVLALGVILPPIAVTVLFAIAAAIEVLPPRFAPHRPARGHDEAPSREARAHMSQFK